MSPEQERFRRAWFSMDREARRRTDRPVLVHGRQSDSSVDPSQLASLESGDSRINLRDPVTGNFWFLLDYSTVDGPDIVAP